MPEGPEVKTVARTLAQNLVGQTLGQLWHSDFKLRKHPDYHALALLKGKLISNVTCYGKVLFLHIDNQPQILAQLGMTGQLKVESASMPIAPHTHVRWPLANTKYELRYVDPRRFGLVDICTHDDFRIITSRLGPDPFALDSQQREALINSFVKSNRVIKNLLLDQSVLVGVGNIYASEALFLSRIAPTMRGCELNHTQVNLLIDSVIQVLKLAYDNSGTSFSNYVDGSGKKGDNLAYLKVFMRDGEACLMCSTNILRIKQSGRSTFYCPHCQNNSQ